jgi:hypothetical protein
MSLFRPLETKNFDGRYKSGDESAIPQTHFQGLTVKGGQIPLLSPQAGHLETRILDQWSFAW